MAPHRYIASAASSFRFQEWQDKVLYLLAGNGTPNFGDELLVQHWLRFYREIGYGGPITVDGKGASASAALLKGFGDVKFVKAIPRHAEGMEGSYADFHEKGVQYAGANLDLFEKVKAFHFLGGGYACANWKNATRMLGAVTELGRRLSVPVVATGLGIAPFRDISDADAAAWRRIVEGCRLFECRDGASFQTLRSFADPKASLSEGLDDAYLYPVRRVEHAGKWLHLSGFNARSVLGPTEQEVPRLFDRFDRVVFWACCKADIDLYGALSERFPQIEAVDNNSLLNEGLPLQSGDFMLTGRFHPHLQAARVGLTGYYAANSDFYRTKHGLVARLGSGFRPLRTDIEVFTEAECAIRRLDAERVQQKRNVAMRVAGLIGLA